MRITDFRPTNARHPAEPAALIGDNVYRACWLTACHAIVEILSTSVVKGVVRGKPPLRPAA